MLIGIDGTGPEVKPNEIYDKTPDYDKLMKNSFVHQLVSNYKGRGAFYFRGPTLSGIECSTIAAQCMIAARNAIVAKDTVDLTGYSRGGAIAIAVAQQIRKEFPAAKIRAIALFDAVDRERSLGDLQSVPGNVVWAFHALRDPMVHSRSYFGNCGTAAEAPCQLVRMTFVTTHGGMGGVPLGKDAPIEEKLRIAVTPEMEKKQSEMVRHWMWWQLRKAGVIR